MTALRATSLAPAELKRGRFPTVVSIRGEAGTGKSLLGSALAHEMMSGGAKCQMMILGEVGSANQLLNQMLAIGLPPFEQIFSNQLDVYERPHLSIDELRHWLLNNPGADCVSLIDNFGRVTGEALENVENRIYDLAVELSATVVLIGPYPPASVNEAMVRVELTRGAVEVERGLWDACVRIKTTNQDSLYLFRIGDRSFHLTEKLE